LGSTVPKGGETLDPAGTWLKNPRGQKYKLKIENGSLVFQD